MARDEDFKERRRREEREAERGGAAPSAANIKKGAPPASGHLGDADQELGTLIAQIPPALEQLDGLYRMFVLGVEKRPPVERRAWVDAAAAKLMQLSKATPAARFRAQSVHASYISHRDLWDKMLKSKERG